MFPPVNQGGGWSVGNGDYSSLKKEYKANSKYLKGEVQDISTKLESIDRQSQMVYTLFVNISQGFSSLDISDKKHLVNLIPPLNDFRTGSMTLELNNALSKILVTKNK